MKKVDAQERLIRLLAAQYDPRKHKGVAAYEEMIDVEKWIAKDLNGHYIEAYAITDQYVDTLVKYSFPEIFLSESQKSTPETIIRILSSLEMKYIPLGFLERYRDFKSTRDDLVHKSIFQNKKSKQLKNDQKLKTIPLQMVKFAEDLFDKRSPVAYLFFLKNPAKSDKTKEFEREFFRLWYRVWEKRGKDLLAFFEDLSKIVKDRKVAE